MYSSIINLSHPRARIGSYSKSSSSESLDRVFLSYVFDNADTTKISFIVSISYLIRILEKSLREIYKGSAVLKDEQRSVDLVADI